MSCENRCFQLKRLKMSIMTLKKSMTSKVIFRVFPMMHRAVNSTVPTPTRKGRGPKIAIMTAIASKPIAAANISATSPLTDLL